MKEPSFAALLLGKDGCLAGGAGGSLALEPQPWHDAIGAEGVAAGQVHHLQKRGGGTVPLKFL